MRDIARCDNLNDNIAHYKRDFVTSDEPNSSLEIAGPDAVPFDELVRQYLKAKHDPRTVVRDEQALYFGTTLEKGSLVPAGKSLLGTCHFADWLSRTAQQK